MEPLDRNSAVLQLEETLLILEESLQENVFFNSAEKHYIKRLKQLYSTRFDIEHSESGSYYYATLQCIKLLYLDEGCIHQIPMSNRFKLSMHYLLDINNQTLASMKNQSIITEQLLSLSELWELHDTFDIADLLVSTLAKMRKDLNNSFETSLEIR